MNACPVVSADRRHGRRYRVERDDLSRETSSAARRLRLAPAPHGQRRYSLVLAFASSRASLPWRVFSPLFRQRASLGGCSRTTPQAASNSTACVCADEKSQPALCWVHLQRYNSINTCISFLDSTAPTAIVLLANRGPGWHSVVNVATVPRGVKSAADPPVLSGSRAYASPRASRPSAPSALWPSFASISLLSPTARARTYRSSVFAPIESRAHVSSLESSRSRDPPRPCSKSSLANLADGTPRSPILLPSVPRYTLSAYTHLLPMTRGHQRAPSHPRLLVPRVSLPSSARTARCGRLNNGETSGSGNGDG
ncbi:hypothetical protein C8R45DRAFT_1216672 [Mycena sanguinolenta]|nr:hypothetical protein C8R45DRAFT_1216672 [Mycena sanguinolenta]